jgi:5-hydroxyisourate hydrolase
LSTVSTHVLDTARGSGAVGVAVRLERLVDRTAQVVGEGVSDGDGRVRDLGNDLAPGTYRLVFATGDYFAGLGQDALFPRVTVEFGLADPARHYHLPLLLSPFGYSTYRGS